MKKTLRRALPVCPRLSILTPQKPQQLKIKVQRVLLSSMLWPTICFGAHPLVSDDTGTQGQNKFQLEINTDASRTTTEDGQTKLHVANTTLTYGVTDTIDIAANLPYQHIRSDGDPTHSGIGDSTLLMKWRFYEKNGFSLALKPQILLPTGNEDKALGNGRVGYGLHTIATFATAAVTVLGNVGYFYNDNRVGARSDLWSISAAVLFNVTPKTKWVIDTGTYRNTDPTIAKNPAFLLTGIIHSVSDAMDLDVGFKKGLNDAEMDASWGLGLTVRW